VITCPILQVEDREEDVFLLQYAFEKADIRNPVHVASDGQIAIDYLSGAGEFADREKHPMPCLVLLDLKLPRKMGLEVLEWIRRDPKLRTLIVIILSSSMFEGDIQRAYELGVNAFLVKPSDSHTMAEICRAIKSFWLAHNKPPLERASLR
jgi:CheY-like chemotaxis protein